MRKILVLVEGQTEEQFVSNVLDRHLWTKGRCAVPTIVTTKRVKATGGQFKGGVPSYEKTKRELARLLEDASAVQVTTFFDYYALPPSFPGMDSRPADTPFARVQHLEDALRADLDHVRFAPFLMLHEFEAMLFSEPIRLESLLQPQTVDRMSAIRASVPTAEEIDETPENAPSRRLRRIFNETETAAYEKPLFGTLLSLEIGLPAIRTACRRFDVWVSALENA